MEKIDQEYQVLTSGQKLASEATSISETLNILFEYEQSCVHTTCQQLHLQLVSLQLKNQFKQYGSKLAYVEDQLTMQSYLLWKSKFESNAVVTKFRQQAQKDIQFIFFCWDWKTLSKWISDLDDVGYLASILSEFRINAMELILFESKHLYLLSNMSKFWRTHIKKMHHRDSLPTGHTNWNVDRFNQTFIILQNKIIQYRLKTIFEMTYKSLWHKICLLSKHPSNRQRSASIIVQIMLHLRARVQDGIQTFWKHDGVFFNKIDNICGLLLMPDDLKLLFAQYFPKYIEEKSADMTSSIDDDDDDETSDEYESDEESDETQDRDNMNDNKVEKFGQTEIARIKNALIQNVQAKTFSYDGQTYFNCVTGHQVAEFLAKSNSYSDIEIVEIGNLLTREKWMLPLNPQHMMRITVTDLTSSNDNVNIPFTNRGTAFYRLNALNLDDKNESYDKLHHDHDHFDENHINNISNNYHDQDFDYNADSFSINVIENDCPTLYRYCFEDFFWQPIVCLMFGVFIGSIILINWWFQQASWQIEESMNWTVQSVAQRALLDLEPAFGIPQSILQIMIGALYINDIPGDKTILNGNYDSFFTSFVKYDPSKSVNSMFVYSHDDDIMIAGYIAADSNVRIAKYDASCLIMETSNGDEKFCNYEPRNRDWYKLSLHLSQNERKWTDIYLFDHQNSYGMSLVENVIFNDKKYIFVVEYSLNNVRSIFNSLSLPLDAVLYLVNDQLLFVGGSDCREGDHKMLSIESCTKNHLIKTSMELLRKNEAKSNLNHILKQGVIKWDQNIATISKFDMSWNTKANTKQTGFLIVAYTDKYRDDIHNMWWITAGVAIGMIFVSFLILIAIQSAEAYLNSTIKNGTVQIDNENNINNDQNQESELIQVKVFRSKTDRIMDVLASFRNKNKFKKIMSISQFSLFATLSIIFLLLNNTTDKSFSTLIESTMIKQEFNQVYDSFYHTISLHSDMILSAIEQRVYLADMPLYDYNANTESTWKGLLDTQVTYKDQVVKVSSIDKYLTNMMHAFSNSKNQYHQHAVYFATPNGTIFGIHSDANATASTPIMWHQDVTTNWVFQERTTDKDTGYTLHDLEGQNEHNTESIGWYDPRCRSWYINSIKYTFSGLSSICVNNDYKINSNSYFIYS